MQEVKEEWMIGNKTNVEKVRKILNRRIPKNGKYHKSF